MRSINVPGDRSREVYGIDAARECREPGRHLAIGGQTGVPGESISRQLEVALDKISDLLVRSGYGLNDVTRMGFFTTDVDGVVGAWPVVRGYFAPGAVPPHTLLGVHRFAHPAVSVEIEATAVREDT
jgi:enamine deaminase RidA (YjgF/YER057c/UK114 family)